MFLKEAAVAGRTVGINTFRRSYEKESFEIFLLRQCALRGAAKNVTAVTMSQGFVTFRLPGHATGMTNLYVTAVTYLCEPGPVS
jgi:hypothetical protein